MYKPFENVAYSKFNRNLAIGTISALLGIQDRCTYNIVIIDLRLLMYYLLAYKTCCFKYFISELLWLYRDGGPFIEQLYVNGACIMMMLCSNVVAAARDGARAQVPHRAATTGRPTLACATAPYKQHIKLFLVTRLLSEGAVVRENCIYNLFLSAVLLKFFPVPLSVRSGRVYYRQKWTIATHSLRLGALQPVQYNREIEDFDLRISSATFPLRNIPLDFFGVEGKSKSWLFC